MTSTLPLVVKDDSEKARQYAIMRGRATMLLGAFGVVFVISVALIHARPLLAPFWLRMLRAAAEAALVGGFADWFAVTALFRHPMGIPIPHTAIVAQRKDRIGRSLGNFVGNNFLSREVIIRQVAGMNLAERGIRWLTLPESQERVARAIAGGVARAAESMPRDTLEESVHNTVVSQLRKVHVAPLLADIIAMATTGDRHQDMLDRLIELLSHVVQENKEIIRVRIAQESPWWVPNAVDDKVYQKIVAGIERTLTDVGTNEHHPLRERFDHALREFMVKLETSPATMARAEEVKERLLLHPAVHELSGALIGAAHTSLARFAEPDAPRPEALENALGAIAERALATPSLLAEVDSALERTILIVVEQYRPEVAELIARVVESWDASDASRKIEVQIGRDLQFIRINGTIVGALVGILLFVINALVG